MGDDPAIFGRSRPGAILTVFGRRLRPAVLFVLAMLGLFGTLASGNDRTAITLELDGAVGPATADYIVRGIDMAAERGAGLVILRMNTPGGLDTSMRVIVSAILASPVPVATFVSPGGSRAASAGTYILYASHVAAMAPGTHLGAATPVAMGGGGLPFGGQEEEDDNEDGATGQPGSAAEAKAINDAVAYIRGLAETRNRNADWAERAVREAATMTASEAARENVIDFTASDMDDLMAKAHGMTVEVNQAGFQLDTRDLTVEAVEPDWRTQFLTVITNPNVALILMMVGVYGLIFEFINPGALVPGTVGGVSLILGLYSLAVLPVTYAGIGLLLLGLALLTAEALTPSFGILGMGGAVALMLGAAVLFDTDVPGMAVSWPIIGAIGAAAALLALIVARLAFSSHKVTVVTGKEELIGAQGEVVDWKGDQGHVFVHGERWKARSRHERVAEGPVRVTRIDGLILEIEPADEPPAGKSGNLGEIS